MDKNVGRYERALNRPWPEWTIIIVLGIAFSIENVVLHSWIAFMVTLAAAPILIGVIAIAEEHIIAWRADRAVRRELDRLDVPAVHDVYVRTPAGHRARIDHVVWLGRAVFVLEIYTKAGTFSRQLRRWTISHENREQDLRENPQAKAMTARAILQDAYPSWQPTVMAITVLTHGRLGRGFENDDFVTTLDNLEETVGHFSRNAGPLPDGWIDLRRFLEANRRTRTERRTVFWNDLTDLRKYDRVQTLGLGIIVGTVTCMFMVSIQLAAAWLIARMFH